MPGALRTSVKVEGYERVVATLRARAARARGRPRVRVAYDAPYATAVHENLNRVYAHGQAKYLEQPARALRGDMARAVRDTMRAGGTILQAELRAAELLFQASQLLVPYRTGRLKRSGSVRVES